MTSHRLLDLKLKTDGAELFSAVMTVGEMGLFDKLAANHSGRGPGVRITRDPLLSRLLSKNSTANNVASQILGGGVIPVRALVFDKSARANWSLGWHQDRTIAVAERIDVCGFEVWSRKSGLQHVEPPFQLLQNMITMRIHVDDAGRDNAPLKIAVGSHTLGRLEKERVPLVVKKSEIVECLAVRGDLWAYSTPILHASDASTSAGRRRVLQIDWANQKLPGGLQWCGI